MRAALRGGNFNNGANAGVFYLNLNNAPSNSNYNIGFRACEVNDLTARRSRRKNRGRCAQLLWNHDPHRKVKNKKQDAPLVGNERGVFPTTLFAANPNLSWKDCPTVTWEDDPGYGNEKIKHLMAKTYKNLYPLIYDFDNIHHAYLKARRGKRFKRDILRFSARLEEALIDIQNHLIWKSYVPGPYKLFTIYEPKERIIAALPFRDRVVHHALCNIIEPIFERSMIHDSHACRRGQGVLSGILRTIKFLRAARHNWGRVYCLKADIAKFFPNIDHDVLKRIIRKRIACPDTLALIDIIIDSNDDDRGLPIGNLTSQLWANVYLNELDHFVKERLDVRHYIRYMDDVVVLHGDKRVLHSILSEIAGFLENKLHLKLNGKTQIFPVGPRSVDFLGYRIWPDYRLLRKGNVKRNKRKFKKFQRLYMRGEITIEDIRPAIMSWIGHCKHADAWRLREKILGQIKFTRSGPA